MPKVGNKHFPYTKAGEAAAKREAARTGKPMGGMSSAMKGVGKKGKGMGMAKRRK